MIKRFNSLWCEPDQGWEDRWMGLTHCPLCIGLAILSAVRFLAHCVLVVQLERARAPEAVQPPTLRGDRFALS